MEVTVLVKEIAVEFGLVPKADMYMYICISIYLSNLQNLTEGCITSFHDVHFLLISFVFRDDVVARRPG